MWFFFVTLPNGKEKKRIRKKKKENNTKKLLEYEVSASILKRYKDYLEGRRGKAV